MISTIFFYLEIFFLSIVSLIFIGHLFYVFFLPPVEKPYQRIFIKIVLGAIIFTVFTAIYQTKGYTILVLFFLLLFYFIYEKQLLLRRIKVSEIFVFTSIKFNVLLVFIPALLFFSWEAFFVFKSGEFNYIISHIDYQYYSELSESMFLTGDENVFGFNPILIADYKGVTPYHYFDMWFVSGVSNLFSSINIVTYMTVGYPIFYLISYLGFCAIWENYGVVRIQEKVFSFFFLGVGSISFLFYDKIPYLLSSSPINVYPIEIVCRKYIIYYPFVIASFLFFYNKKYSLAIIALLALPIISIGSAPGVLSGIILFSIVGVILKRLEKRLAFKISAYSFLFLFSIACFYLFSPKPSLEIDNFKEVMNLKTWLSFDSYKTILNIYVVTIFQYIIYYLPFILLLTLFSSSVRANLFKIKTISIPSLFLICVFIASLSSWAFLNLLGNASQFFSNGVSVVLNVWIVAGLIYVRSVIKKKRLYLVVLFLILIPNFYYSYSKNENMLSVNYEDRFVLKVNSEINLIDKRVVNGGVIFSKIEMENLTFLRRKAFHVFPSAYYTNYAEKTVNIENLSVLDAPQLKDELNERRSKAYMVSAPFYLFVQKQKDESKFITIEKSQLEFINEFNLSFVVVRKDAEIPSYIVEIQKEIIIDNKSGDRFILLK